MKKIKLNLVHILDIRAASGLIKREGTFYVIADDELNLTAFNFEKKPNVKNIPLLKGSLPEDPVQRKKLKPDWEALVQIDLKNEEQIILAVPSGSTEQRSIGAYVDKNMIVHTVDFSKIYSDLSHSLIDLNIEGACVFQNKLKLFQRGNGARGKNAIIDLDLAGICNDLQNNISLQAKWIQSITDYDLGEMNGFQLDFTDACALEDTIWFLAVAENSGSTYDDGQYYGAILGCFDVQGVEIARYEIDCATKPEGLWVEHELNRLCFYIVTDADNRNVFASLYFGKLL